MKNNKKTPNLKHYLIFISCLFLFTCVTACFEPETGCLDIEAKNFDPTADEMCGEDDRQGNCPCTYPVLSIDTIDYLFAKADFAPNTIYQLEEQFIIIDQIRFFLSGFQFIRNNSDQVIVADTISLIVTNDEGQQETSIVTDDYILVEQQSSIDIGAVQESGQFDSLRFVVGIEGNVNTTDPVSVNNSQHPLADASMHFGNTTDGYIFNQIIIQTDTFSQVQTTINIGTATNLVEIKLPFSYESPIGSDFSLGTLHIDHSKWFDGINFVADNEADIIDKIITNTPTVFSISP